MPDSDTGVASQGEEEEGALGRRGQPGGRYRHEKKNPLLSHGEAGMDESLSSAPDKSARV